MDAKATGDFIAQLRKENDITQKQLAEAINVTDKAVSRWETGKGFPDVSSLLAVSEKFSVSVNELLLGERIKPSEAEKAAEQNVVSVFEKSYAEKIRLKRIIAILATAAAIFLIVCLLSVPDLPTAISHKIEGGYTVVTLSSSTVDISDYQAQIYYEGTEVDLKNVGDGFWFKNDYGKYYGTVNVSSDNPDIDGRSFDFGFFNDNNWHKVSLNLSIDIVDNSFSVKQTVTYLTEGGGVAFRETHAETDLNSHSDINVQADGIS